MAEKSGKCTNLGSCTEAGTGRVISLPMSQDFKCPECGSTLVETKTYKGGKSPMVKIVVAVAVVIALMVVTGIFFFGKKEPEIAKKIPPPSPTVVAPAAPQPSADIKTVAAPPPTTTQPSVAGRSDSKKRQAPSEGKVKNVSDVVRGDQGDKDKSPSKAY